MSENKTTLSKESEKELAEILNFHGGDDAVDTVETFFEKNWKKLLAVVGIIVALTLAYFGYKYMNESTNEEAAKELFAAEYYFKLDSFQLALKGDKQRKGFEYIANEYGSTKSGNLSKYYAGICCMNLGKFQDAINYFEDYSANDILSGGFAKGLTGDAYSELGKSTEAIDNYLKAADINENELTSPMYLNKAAGLYEDAKQNDKALELYKRIQKDYYNSDEGRNAEKYINRLEALTGK